jgi:DNA-binding beta-propeller fold protein YncE
MILFVALLHLLLVSHVSASDLPEWVYVLQDDQVLVGNAREGGIAQTIQLSRQGAIRVHPTPGGKFVFVTFRDSRDAAVIDAESHEITRFVTFDFEPAYIQFSPMGETAYVSDRRTNEIRVFDHRKAEFTYVKSISVGKPGTPVLLNRRGTRLYRADRGGVVFIYLKTGEIIAEVEAPGFPAHFAIAPDFRTLWGVSEENGSLIIVDEARGRVLRSVELESGSAKPVFHEATGIVLLGRRLAIVQSRNFRVQKYLALQKSSDQIVVSSSGRVWSRFEEGIEHLTLDDPEESVLIELDSSPLDFAYVVVRSGEGFACF